MGEDVEQARAGGGGERLEVARPDPVGVAGLVPDVEALVVDRVVADEVDRADDVVEVARLEQVRGAVLGAGDEVHLDPEPQLGAADELAVGVDVVLGLFAPERVVPELERLGEAVDVLGDAELGDPGRRRRLEVAVDVLGGEVALGGRPVLVGAEVEVVVGQHATEPRRRRARIRSWAWSTCGSSSRETCSGRVRRPARGLALDLQPDPPRGRGAEARGDVILCDVAREEASVLIEDLKELGVARHGSISIEEIDSQISEAARRAEKRRRGHPADAVVWEEVEARTSEDIELSRHLPGLHRPRLPDRLGRDLRGLADPDRRRDDRRPRVRPARRPLRRDRRAPPDLALRSLAALAVGFPIGISAAFLFTLFCVATGIVDSSFHSSENELVEFIVKPERVLGDRRPALPAPRGCSR